jgi:hypothetical protein
VYIADFEAYHLSTASVFSGPRRLESERNDEGHGCASDKNDGEFRFSIPDRQDDAREDKDAEEYGRLAKRLGQQF